MSDPRWRDHSFAVNPVLLHMSAPTTYNLISSTRYDKTLLDVDWNTAANGGEPSPFLLLPYNLDRLTDAVRKHGWVVPEDLLTMPYLLDVCKASVDLAVSKNGDVPMKVSLSLLTLRRSSFHFLCHKATHHPTK